MKYLLLLSLILVHFSLHAETKKEVFAVKSCRLGDLEPSPSSPPNNTDDPGITDTGCFEINNTVSRDYARNADGTYSNYDDAALDMNYGVRPDLQAKVVIHYNSQELYGLDTGNSRASSIGRVELGAKKTIYNNEEKNLTIGIFPTVDFMMPGNHATERGLPDTGTNLTLPVLVSKRYGPVIFVNNAGVVMSLNDSSKPAQIILSTSAGVNISKNTIVTGEVYRTSGTDFKADASTSVGVGFTTKLSDNASLYMSLGKSIGSTADGSSHVYALAGVKVLFGKGARDSKELKLNFHNNNEEF